MMLIRSFNSTIPLLDMTRPGFAKQLGLAFSRYGFAGIINTKITGGALKDIYRVSKDFFALPQSEKEKISGKKIGGERGYTGSSESPVGKNINTRDAKEFLHFGGPSGPIKNLWPEAVQMKKPVTGLYNQLGTLVTPLANAIEEALGAPKGYVNNKVKDGDHLLRLVRYPGTLKKGEEGAAAHTDSNFFTLLPPATSKGLQVFFKKEWVDVVVPEQAVIVNVGSMLEHMTNGYFHGALHRVVKHEIGGPDRYSVALFIHSKEHDSMSPLQCCIEKTGGIQKYPDATRQFLLYQRLYAMGRATPEIEKQFFSWGGINRWENFLVPDDPRTFLSMEIAKVKALSCHKRAD